MEINRLLIQETRPLWDMNAIGKHDIVVIRNIKPDLGLPRQDYYGMVINCSPESLWILLNINYEGYYHFDIEAHTQIFRANDEKQYDIQVMIKAVKGKD